MSSPSLHTSVQAHRLQQSYYQLKTERAAEHSGEQEQPNKAESADTAKPVAYEVPKAEKGLAGRTDAANTILGFIAGRLHLDQAEGATKEQLESRLQAGLDGFVEGFSQAYEQLSALAMLYPEVEDAIEKTYSDVLNGIDGLAEELGVESPVMESYRTDQQERRQLFNASQAASSSSVTKASSVDVAKSAAEQQALSEADNLRSLIDASSYDYRAHETRSFNFQLKTADGDSVTIRAAYSASSVLEGQRVQHATGSDSELQASFYASAGFYLDIEGELDESELAAIEDLLTQVREVSGLFFSGDIQSAFEHATELGFNSDEISRFSLQLRYERSEQYQASYAAQPARAAATGESFDKQDQQLMSLARFVQALEDMRQRADESGLLSLPGVARGQTEGKDSIDKVPNAVETMSKLLDSLQSLAGS
ncbi:DUF5610 domain-containing protein [Agaribacterium sp. ZY112]|uniref:DUF5610 domain-containing protein n=1 Tax=Agaribacterium sp. ZY112 TaxID=3233574 RepID=UPI003523207E